MVDGNVNDRVQCGNLGTLIILWLVNYKMKVQTRQFIPKKKIVLDFLTFQI